VPTSKPPAPIGPSDHILGDVDAPITLLEYGDYECPYCGRAHPVVMEVLRRAGSDVRFVFRHFPLVELHPHALEAAEAAEAAGAQGQFWPMHESLIEHQRALDPKNLSRYAASLNLDLAQFEADLSTDRHLAKIERDIESGLRASVKGTPTFFIQGVQFEAPWSVDTLLAALRAATRAA